MAETREPGWYADPWGTEDERYFDGSAWTRQVRPPSAQSGETPGETPVETSVETSKRASRVATGAGAVPSAQLGVSPPPTVSDAPPAAGWHADPWGDATWRWWDGAQWTGYTDRTSPLSSGAAVAAELATERTWARWARIGFAVNPIFQVLALVAASFQWRWIADHWDEVTKGTNTEGTDHYVTTQNLAYSYGQEVSAAAKVIFADDKTTQGLFRLSSGGPAPDAAPTPPPPKS